MEKPLARAVPSSAYRLTLAARDTLKDPHLAFGRVGLYCRLGLYADQL